PFKRSKALSPLATLNSECLTITIIRSARAAQPVSRITTNSSSSSWIGRFRSPEAAIEADCAIGGFDPPNAPLYPLKHDNVRLASLLLCLLIINDERSYSAWMLMPAEIAAARQLFVDFCSGADQFSMPRPDQSKQRPKI